MILSPLADVAYVALAVWVYLAFLHGRFWHGDQRLDEHIEPPAAWPAIAVVIPARNEAEVIGRAVASILAQDYAGRMVLVVVDDGSGDGTGKCAREADDGSGRLTVITAQALARGWTGKLWALQQGVDAAAKLMQDARYVLFTDADIEHDKANLARLAAKAELESLDLVSLMVRLHCAGPWERLLIPAFVFFFQKLYPFPRVNDASRTAAAAGGCMLVRMDALARAGGLESIRGRVIDDCALARRIKRSGPVWLGLTRRTNSLRAYGGLGGIWDMVARTAFVQLGGSAVAAVAAAVAMVLVYLAPPVAAIAGLWTMDAAALASGLLGWALMARCYAPTLRDYGLSPWQALLLPVAALFYGAMTLDSARRGIFGQGAAWKGRSY